MEFELTPVSTGTLVTLGVITAVMVLTASMFAWMSWSASRGSITVTRDAIEVNVPFYGRAIPTANLDLAHAQVLSADQAADIRGSLRTNGIGMPGYSVGWFKLASGGKALLAVTSGRVLFIPTTEGYSLLVTVDRPDALLTQLRSVGART